MELESEKSSKSSVSGQRRVGLLYDERMCKHQLPTDEYHLETPNRIRAIWNKLQSTNILDRYFMDLFLLKIINMTHIQKKLIYILRLHVILVRS